MIRHHFSNGGMGEIPPDARPDSPAPAFGLPPNVAVTAKKSGLTDKMSSWQVIPINAGLTVIKLQDYTLRKFLLLQNLDTTGTLYFGFGWVPSPTLNLRLGPGEGYEPFSYPTNEIYVLGSEADVNGIMLIGV